MYNFCTLFDSNYLSRGLTMYKSLENVCDDFHLYIFAFDEKCFSILNKLNLKHATIISLKDFEDEELLKIKSSRTPVEYCWTSTSSTILYTIKKFNLQSCTYIDADLFFYSSPKPIFDEMKNASILLTLHRYTKKYDKSKISGKYCVQFITFKNDDFGLEALQWWREKCLDWCYNKIEDGKFGDQKYLDDWTERFKNVHVLKNEGAGVAAWNVQQYDLVNQNNSFLIKVKNRNENFNLIFYHFHYLRFYTNGKIDLGRRILSKDVINNLYKPYAKKLSATNNELQKFHSGYDFNGATKNPLSWKTPILFLYRKIMGFYNIFNFQNFIS